MPPTQGDRGPSGGRSLRQAVQARDLQLGPLAGTSPRLARRVGVPPQLPHRRHLLRPRGGPPRRRSVARAASFRPIRPQPEKYITYESGVDPVGFGWTQSQIRYYIFALLFVMFDVEAVFIFPWATRLEEYGVFGLVEMVVFIVSSPSAWSTPGARACSAGSEGTGTR